jgi:hypothetical protein
MAADSARLQQTLTSYNVIHGDVTGVAKGVSGTGMPSNPYGGMRPGMPYGTGMPPGMPSGMGMPGVRPGAATPGTPEVSYRDPLTEEDITKDWVCTVLFAVVLDPPDSMVAAEAAPTMQTTEPTTK